MRIKQLWVLFMAIAPWLPHGKPFLARVIERFFG